MKSRRSCASTWRGAALKICRQKKRKALRNPWQPPRTYVHAWSLHLCRALAYLHGSFPALVHRDVKPGNILLSRDLSEVKLADFGLARTCSEGAYDMTGLTGTKRYMAPEVYRQEKDYGPGVDVYSAAVIMWQMCTGHRPWETHEADEVARRGASEEELRPPLNELSWVELRPIIAQAWRGDPSQRPSANEMLSSLETVKGRPGMEKKCFIGMGSCGVSLSCWKGGGGLR
mmetsp:Transcript_43484/g.84968  ORF Transcript_43484/g.84968 Transcript_43484/m.84968 type:complete len:230 (+) Transcript_43484:573-1262(+)